MSNSALSSSKQLTPPPLVATYAVTKMGHTGASKKRLLYVRSDIITFLDVSTLAPSAPSAAMHAMGLIKRIIPIPCIHAMISFEDGKQLQLLVRNEHDVFLWKEDSGPIDDIVNVLLKLTRQSGNPVQYTQESGQVDPDEMRLEKFPGYTTIARRCELRRSKSKLALPSGPITLQSWDAIASPLPFALDPKKMTASLQKTFDGMHIVMMGSVLVHTSLAAGSSGSSSSSPTTKVLAFTPTRLISCDEDTGREYLSCCLFAMSRVVLHTREQVVALHLSDEAISTFFFSFPQVAKTNGAHVSDDIGVVSNVIRFLLAREGIDLSVERTAAVLANSSSGGSQQSPQSGGDGGQTSSALPAPTTTTTPPPLAPRSVTPPPLTSAATAPPSTQSPSTSGPTSPAMSKQFSAVAQVASPSKGEVKDDVASKVPDYRAPIGEVPQRFRSPQVFLARQVLRLTSKGAWEPRVLLIVAGARVIICDERTNVKRSIPLDHVTDVASIVHWEGNALALRVRGEHDLVVRLHPDTPPTLTIEQIVIVLQAVYPSLQQPRTDTIETKERLKDLVLRERPMKKGSSFVPPAREASIAQQTALLSRTSSVAPPPSAAASTRGPSPNVSAFQDDSRRGSVATAQESDASTAAFVSSPSSNTLAPSAQPSSVFDPAERRLSYPAQPSLSAAEKLAQVTSLQDDEYNARLLLEALEEDGALAVLHWAGDSERRATEREALRNASARSKSDVERQALAARAATNEAYRQAVGSIIDSERQRRRSVEDNAADAFELMIRDERTARLWVRTNESSLQAMAHRSNVSRSFVSEAGREASAPPADQQGGRSASIPFPNAPPTTTTAAGYELELSPISITDDALPPVSQRQSVSPSPASRSIDFPPPSSSSLSIAPMSRYSDVDRGGNRTQQQQQQQAHNDAPIAGTSTTVMFKKEVQLFSATSPRAVHTTPRSALPAATSSATRFGSASLDHNGSQRSLDLSAIHNTPSQYAGLRTSTSALLNNTPRTAHNHSNRLIVFPTPSSSASDASGLTRGADGSKNCFFRVKIGVSDAIAVVGNEKFAASIHERYHGPDAANNTKPTSAYKDHLAINASNVVDQRIICVSNDEPRISCGDLTSYLDILRSGSMRSWIRRDVVMVRSTSFLWVELGVIPFVVAVEKGERPAHIADRLLEGGTPGNATMPSLMSM